MSETFPKSSSLRMAPQPSERYTRAPPATWNMAAKPTPRFQPGRGGRATGLRISRSTVSRHSVMPQEVMTLP